MSEVVTSLADPSANVIFGAVIDDQVGGSCTITVCCTITARGCEGTVGWRARSRRQSRERHILATAVLAEPRGGGGGARLTCRQGKGCQRAACTLGSGSARQSSTPLALALRSLICLSRAACVCTRTRLSSHLVHHGLLPALPALLQYEGEIHVTIIATGFSQTFEENLWGGKSSTVSSASKGNGRPVPVQQAAPQQQMPPPQLRQLQQQAAPAEPARPSKRGWW